MIGNHKCLGQGSQFNVYMNKTVRPNERGFTTQLVAAKEPMYIFKTDQRLNLADASSKRPLQYAFGACGPDSSDASSSP